MPQHFYEEKLITTAFDVSRTWVKEGNHNYAFGLSIFNSGIEEKVDGIKNRDATAFWLSPRFTYDGPKAAITIGVHAGDIYRLKTRFDEDDNTLIGRSGVLPQFALRIGSGHKFYVNSQFYTASAPSMPLQPIQLGFGYGFRSKYQNSLEIGHSSFSAIYLSSSLSYQDKLIFKPYIGLGGGLFNSFNTSDGPILALSVIANFNRKARP
jgi:hypothetical protein